MGDAMRTLLGMATRGVRAVVLDPDDGGLFPEPPRTIEAEPDNLSDYQKFKRRVRLRISVGMHPLGYVPLHKEACWDPDNRHQGPRCGGCAHRVHDEGYPKCALPAVIGDRTTYPRVSRSSSSDIAAWWPACRDYERKPDGADRQAS